MYHHVVNPEDFRMRTGFGFDFFYELRIRCGSDYVIFVFIQNFQSGNKYEYCDCRSYITVEVNSRKMRNKQCNKHRTGWNNIRKAVGRRCHHNRRINGTPDRAVKKIQNQLEAYRNDEDTYGKQTEFGLCGMYYLIKRICKQLKTDYQNNKRND